MSVRGFDPLVAALGVALVHFFWQGFVIAALLELVLAALRDRSAEVRYAVRCGALALMAAAPLVTIALVSSAAPGAIDAAVVPVLEPGSWASWPFLVVCGWSVGKSPSTTSACVDACQSIK